MTRRWITYRAWFPRWPRIGLFGYWGEPVNLTITDANGTIKKTVYIRKVVV